MTPVDMLFVAAGGAGGAVLSIYGTSLGEKIFGGCVYAAAMGCIWIGMFYG